MNLMNTYKRLDPIKFIIGILLALILSVVLGIIGGSLGGYIGFFLATTFIGFLDYGDITEGAIYGALILVVAGLIFTTSMLLFGGMMGNMDQEMMRFGWSGIIIGIILNAVIGAMGGIVGAGLNRLIRSPFLRSY